jgi:hypothetical protein
MNFELPLGDWTPDAPAFKNPGLVDALNVYPSAGGYSPFPSPVAQSDTTTEVVTGADMFFDVNSNAVICGGSSTRLFTLRSSTVTETTGYSATASGWKFERFKDLIIAASIENDLQYLTDIDTDDTWSVLTGTPPKAAQIGRVDDFIVVGDLVDIEAGNPTVHHRIRWSAKNNPAASWATDRGTMCGYQDLDPADGKITAIVGGRFGLVFQERAIRRMVFVGAPQVFDFPYVAVGQGAVAPGSVVTIGADTFFLSQDGFHRTNGSDIQNIGYGRINEWFSAEVSDVNISKTHGAINWPQKCIVWAFYPSGGSTFAKLLIYNFALDRWSYSDQNLHYLVQTRVNSETLASLASTFPGGIGTMSAYTLGTSEWRAKDLGFAAYVTSGAGSDFATMDGAALAASFLTGEAMLEPGYRTKVGGVWPGVETMAATVTTSVRSRTQQGGDVSTTTPTVKAADGFCPHNVDNWLHAIRMSIPAATVWDNATNVLVRAKRSGRR